LDFQGKSVEKLSEDGVVFIRGYYATMVVNDMSISGVAAFPLKYNPPLVIDSN
jgi:hypothetical protein